MDFQLTSSRDALFSVDFSSQLEARIIKKARHLQIITSNIKNRNFEQTAHALLDWPSIVDDLSAILLVDLSNGDHETARLAIECLGHVFCVGIRPRDLDLMFDVAQSHPAIASTVLRALEDAAKSRNERSKPCSFWVMAGWCSKLQRCAMRSPDYLGSAVDTSGQSESSFLSLSWERWPFPREYSLWMMVRVAAFGKGNGEDKSTLLRVLAGNGARLHIWVEHKALHVTVQVGPLHCCMRVSRADFTSTLLILSAGFTSSDDVAI